MAHTSILLVDRRYPDPLTPMVEVTNGHGSIVLTEDEVADQPHPSSVVLTSGEHGTAWQRYFSDGLWHRVGGGKPRTWDWLLMQRNLRLLYDAPPREDTEPRE